MKFELIKNNTNPLTTSTVERVLNNRGIINIEKYLNTTDEDINSPLLFGQKRLADAARTLIKNIQAGKNCLVVVDSDCDGYTSSAILINYLYDLFPAWVQNHLRWFIHDGKQHGLSDCIAALLECNYSLVILPDSSSNDFEYHKELYEDATDVIVLDHHEASHISEHACVINNQLSDYPNKDFSGAGVTWQFCRYIDSLMKTNYADEYIDLVALGNCADMMDTRSIETKHVINKGFKQENLKNPFIYEMANKNHFKLGNGDLTFMGVAFYIAPFVNAMVRSGTQDEKHTLFNSMLKFRAFEKIPSTKRGHKLGEMERVVDQAIRTVTNVKNRQTRAQDAGMELLEGMIESQNLLEHKVLLFLLEPGQIDRNIAGLVANKLMAKYQRPCCVLTKVVEKLDYIELQAYPNEISIPLRLEKEKVPCKPYTRVSYQGSARGYDKSGVNNFKDICAAAPSVIFAEGHQSAFGLGIECGYLEEEFGAEVYGEGILQFLYYIDEALKDMVSEPMYRVDYLYTQDTVDADTIIEIAEMCNIWSSSVDEPLIAIQNLKITKGMLNFYKENTIKITLNNNVAMMLFNTDRETYEKLYSEDGFVEINAVCRCNKNEWNGYVSAQLFIEEFEILDSCVYIF